MMKCYVCLIILDFPCFILYTHAIHIKYQKKSKPSRTPTVAHSILHGCCSLGLAEQEVGRIAQPAEGGGAA